MRLDFKNNLALQQWLNLRQKAVALLTCIFVYFYIRNSRKRKICYSMSSERERAREELMGELSKPGKSHDIVRMNYEAFLKLCDLL